MNHRRPRSTSLLIQMKTMKNLEMSLEPLQTLNLLHQYFVITLVMKTVSTATSSERTLFHPDLYFWPTMSIGQWRWRHKYAATAGSYCFVTTEKWRSTVHMQFDHYAECATIIVFQWSDQRLWNYKNWSTWWSWWSNKRHVGTLYDYLQKSCRNKSQNEISCTQGSISPRSSRILPTICWSETSWIQILGWEQGFWSHWLEEGNAEKVCYRTMGTYYQDRQARLFLQSQGQMGAKRFPR